MTDISVKPADSDVNENGDISKSDTVGGNAESGVATEHYPNNFFWIQGYIQSPRISRS